MNYKQINNKITSVRISRFISNHSSFTMIMGPPMCHWARPLDTEGLATYQIVESLIRIPNGSANGSDDDHSIVD